MNITRFLHRMFGSAEPVRHLHMNDQTLYCALCYRMNLHPGLPIPEGSKAVTIIDGNAACQDHLDLLVGRTVVEALEVLIAQADNAAALTILREEGRSE